MYYALGLLASNIVLVFTRILSPTMSFEVGQIASIPVYYKPNSTIDSLVKENIELSKKTGTALKRAGILRGTHWCEVRV